MNKIPIDVLYAICTHLDGVAVICLKMTARRLYKIKYDGSLEGAFNERYTSYMSASDDLRENIKYAEFFASIVSHQRMTEIMIKYDHTITGIKEYYKDNKSEIDPLLFSVKIPIGVYGIVIKNSTDDRALRLMSINHDIKYIKVALRELYDRPHIIYDYCANSGHHVLGILYKELLDAGYDVPPTISLRNMLSYANKVSHKLDGLAVRSMMIYFGESLSADIRDIFPQIVSILAEHETLSTVIFKISSSQTLFDLTNDLECMDRIFDLISSVRRSADKTTSYLERFFDVSRCASCYDQYNAISIAPYIDLIVVNRDRHSAIDRLNVIYNSNALYKNEVSSYLRKYCDSLYNAVCT